LIILDGQVARNRVLGGSYPILATALAYVRAKATIRTERDVYVHPTPAVDKTTKFARGSTQSPESRMIDV
jgi:hypothetical protein